MIYISLCSSLDAKKEYEIGTDLIKCFGKEADLRLEKISSASSLYLSFGGLLALKSLTNKFISGNADLSVAYGEFGKPFFKSLKLPFSISHTGSLSVAALENEYESPIGVDIELIDKRRNLKQIAERFFLEYELSSLKEHDYSADEFYKLWTSKEAYVKLCGTSLSSILGKSDTVKLCSDKTIFFTHLKIKYDGDEYILTVAATNKTNTEIFDMSKDLEIKII